jgi:hypothetical protein
MVQSGFAGSVPTNRLSPDRRRRESPRWALSRTSTTTTHLAGLITIDEARVSLARASAADSAASHQLGLWSRWERLKAGEKLEDLVAEAKAASVQPDTRTSNAQPGAPRPSKKSRARAEAVATPQPETAES